MSKQLEANVENLDKKQRDKMATGEHMTTNNSTNLGSNIVQLSLISKYHCTYIYKYKPYIIKQ